MLHLGAIGPKVGEALALLALWLQRPRRKLCVSYQILPRMYMVYGQQRND